MRQRPHVVDSESAMPSPRFARVFYHGGRARVPPSIISEVPLM